MAEINFLDIFHNKNDKETLKNMVDEITQLYGFPCVLKRWTGMQTQLDPLYGDQLSAFQNDEEMYDPVNSYVYIDYLNLNQTLQSFGLAHDKSLTLNGFMRLDDQPRENDILTIKLPYDDNLITLKIGSADIYKDICFSVILLVAHFDQQRARG